MYISVSVKRPKAALVLPLLETQRVNEETAEQVTYLLLPTYPNYGKPRQAAPTDKLPCWVWTEKLPPRSFALSPGEGDTHTHSMLATTEPRRADQRQWPMSQHQGRTDSATSEQFSLQTSPSVTSLVLISFQYSNSGNNINPLTFKS